MPLKQFTTDFQRIGQQEFLRPNVGYRYFFDVQKAEVYPTKQSIKLKYVLKELPAKKVSKGELEETERLIDIGNIERRFNNLINVEEVDEVGSDKSILQNGDIVIPKMQPQMGNIFLNLEHERFIGSTELLEYSISTNHNPLFLYYLITSGKFLSDLAKLESGKTHRRVNPADLLKIKIPAIPKFKQDQIVAEIGPIEKKIKELKSQITPPQEIINKVFAREFKFDLEKFEQLKKERFFEVDFRNFNDYKLRASFKSNNHSIKFLLKFLNNKSILLKDFLISNIISGDTPRYSEDGEYRVIKTINVNKDGFVEKFSDDKFVNKTEKILECKNILVTTHGEGRGKFGIYTFDDLATTDANCSIVKFNLNKINPLYLNYYFNSFFGKELFYYLESETKSVRYMKNDDLETMPILFSKKSQQKIVDEIKTELDKQEEMKKKIETQRNKIDEIIEKAVI